MKQIEEGNERYLIEVSFYNKNNDAQLPSSVSYSVYCVTTETNILTDVSISPDYIMDINITGDMVVLQDSTNKRELKSICIEAVDINGNTLYESYEYEVIQATSITCA